MGTLMKITNSGAVVDGFARDGREFGHVTENLRDALLNGAKNVEFRIHGLYPDRECVARRVIADDGTGMTEGILRDVYHNFSATGTDHDFQVELNDDCTVTVTTAVANPGGQDHAHDRRGFGGRGSLTAWNPLGVVTVTIHEGHAQMVWMYRGFGGDNEMRDWIEGGKKRSIVTPYTEPTHLDRDALIADRPFAKLLLVSSGTCTTEDDATELINSMTLGDLITNPLAGIEWDGDIVPKWVIDHYDEDGLARRTDGTLAHGTVKVLLGRNPYDSTAMTGDPNFIGEADFKKYNGVCNRFWLDLAPWQVRVWTLRIPPRDGRIPYRIVGYPGVVTLDGGDVRSSTKPSGREQDGALGIRRKPTDKGESRVNYQSVLDLGIYGRALLVYRTGDAGTSSDDLSGSSRKGVICAVYGNEVHGVVADLIDTPDYAYLGMGIPTTNKVHHRVSLFLFPPRMTTTTPGVYQSSARDRLKWSGQSDGFPMTGENGLNATVARALPDEFRKLLRESTGDSEIRTFDRAYLMRIRKLFSGVKDMAQSGRDMLLARNGTGEALIGDGSPEATTLGTPIGNQGSPGTAERPPCPECGLRIHAADCSRKPEPLGRRGGGKSGPFIRLTPDAAGAQSGRTSRARAATPETPDEGKKDIQPEPPGIHWTNEPPMPEQPQWPITYVKPGTWFPDTGDLTVNRDHLAVQRLLGLANTAKRDPDMTVRATEEWIEARLADFLFGTLTTYGQEFVSMERGNKKDAYELADEILGKPETWFMALSSLYFADASLKSYITSHVPVATGKPKKVA